MNYLPPYLPRHLPTEQIYLPAYLAKSHHRWRSSFVHIGRINPTSKLVSYLHQSHSIPPRISLPSFVNPFPSFAEANHPPFHTSHHYESRCSSVKSSFIICSLPSNAEWPILTLLRDLRRPKSPRAGLRDGTNNTKNGKSIHPHPPPLPPNSLFPRQKH